MGLSLSYKIIVALTVRARLFAYKEVVKINVFIESIG